MDLRAPADSEHNLPCRTLTRAYHMPTAATYHLPADTIHIAQPTAACYTPPTYHHTPPTHPKHFPSPLGTQCTTPPPPTPPSGTLHAMPPSYPPPCASTPHPHLPFHRQGEGS